MAPVILVTFAGRERRMDILTHYVRAALERGLIDEWHVWDFTRSAEDHAWVSRTFGPVRYMSPTVPYQGAGSIAPNRPFRLEATITNDLHIALVPRGQHDHFHEFVIGGWVNSHSAARTLPIAYLGRSDRSDTTPVFTQPTPGILSPGLPNDIVVSLDAGGHPTVTVNGAVLARFTDMTLPEGAEVMLRGGFGGSLEIGGLRDRVQRFIGNPGEQVPYWQAYYFYGRRARDYADAVFLKCDDDIVYLDLDGLSDFIEFRRTHPHYFLVSANVVNNGVCAYWQQVAGHLPASLGTFERPPGGFGGSLWQGPERATALHRYFLGLEVQKLPLPGRVIEWRERQSINFVAWLGRDLKHLALPKCDDENALSVAVPDRLGRPSALFSDFTVSHLSFGPQERGLEVDPLIDAYEALMRRTLYAS